MTDTLEILGMKIPMNPDIITPQIAQSIERGAYEKDEVSGTPKFVKPDDRVIELGSGIGFISTFLYTHLNVENILCIEADPNLCAFIKQVHELNGVETAQIRNAIALNGETPQSSDSATFYIRNPFWSSSLDAKPEYTNTVQVPTIPLSELIQDFKANTLIVDIEGGERDIFIGTDLTGIDKIYLEIHTRKIRRIGIKQCFDALSEAGFVYDQQVSHKGAVLFQRIPSRQLRRYYRAKKLSKE